MIAVETGSSIGSPTIPKNPPTAPDVPARSLCVASRDLRVRRERNVTHATAKHQATSESVNGAEFVCPSAARGDAEGAACARPASPSRSLSITSAA